MEFENTSVSNLSAEDAATTAAAAVGTTTTGSAGTNTLTAKTATGHTGAAATTTVHTGAAATTTVHNMIPTAVPYAKPFPDISKIEMFGGQNYKRWQERIFSILDMHGVGSALTDPKPEPTGDPKLLDMWTYANKVCRHTIISTLTNDLFDVYCSYKEAKDIWESMNLKYTAEDAGKQKFVIGNFYRWTMEDGKDIKMQINEYHKLLEDLKAENITLQEEFVAGILIEKLPESWKDYKQQLKHKHKQLSLGELITHIIIEDTNRRELELMKGREMASNANLVQGNSNSKKQVNKPKNDYKPRVNNSSLFKKRNCYVCGSTTHVAAQCKLRVKNGNPPKPNANLVEGEDDDIIVAVVSQANLVADVKEWVVDSGATRHICANREAFNSYTSMGKEEEHVYFGDSRTAQVLGKGKVLLKLTSGKILALNNVLHVPNIRANLISVSLLGKVGVKVMFESDQIVMTKNSGLVGRGYCNQGLFVLSISNVIDGNASTSS